MKGQRLLLGEEVFRIIGSAFKVHNELGPGFLEAVYHEALEIQFAEDKIPFRSHERIWPYFKGQRLRKWYEADFLCFESIIVEIKAADRLAISDQAVVLNYLIVFSFHIRGYSSNPQNYASRPPLTRLNPLKLLHRTDKWYLGGGNRLIYAPPFPLHRRAPGLWDTAHYYNYPFQPLFTWAILTVDGKPLSVEFDSTDWQPDRLFRHFSAVRDDVKLAVEERSCVLPNDVAVSVLQVRNRGAKRLKLRLVAWTAREHFPNQSAWMDQPEAKNGMFTCTTHVKPAKRKEIGFATAFGMSGRRLRCSGQLSEGIQPPPDWHITPFAELALKGPLPDLLQSGGVSPEGMYYVALEREITLAPRGSTEVSVGLATGLVAEEVRSNLAAVLRLRDPIRLSEISWADHFASVPFFSSSDPYFSRYYWYRWYGLRLNTIFAGEGNYEYPAVCEGIGDFRVPISYSAPCHMFENRWMHDPELAQGSLLTFIHNQREDGGFRGYIDVSEYRTEMFYHANWGRAIAALDAVHPSPEFLEQAYDGLKNYAAYFDRERDEEVSGLYDIDNHYETGQEYMHRYTAVDANADKDNWGEVFRLKGVDVTVYLYDLKRALAAMAEKLGKNDEAELWTVEASKIKDAVLQLMWDPTEEMFFDVDPKKGVRTGVKASTCFYPYFTDIVGREHIPGLKRHLLSPKEFWTPFPVPSTSCDDETFNPEPVWKGKRMNCPWNGRVWPMTNSHVVEALAQTALRFADTKLERAAADMMQKFIRMMFFDDDPKRPNCYEHYNPLTGTPSSYRGVDDYMHSWVNDLIVKYVMGIQPGQHSLTIRPLRCGLAYAEIREVMVRGRRIDVTIRGNRFVVKIDGRRKIKETLGESVEVQM